MLLGSVAIPARPARAQGDAPSAPSEPPPEGATAEYRARAAEGFDEFQRGNYPEALALFERAYAAHASPRMLRAVAKCLFELRRYADAVIACDGALAADRDALGEGLRADVRELRARALGFTGVVRLLTDPPSADVLVDGRRITTEERSADLRVDLGRHLVEASARGRVPVRRELVVDAGRQVEIRLELPRATGEAGQNSRTGTYVMLGAGGAVAAGAVLSSTLWFLDRSRAVSTCNDAAAGGARCDNGSQVATQRDLSIAAMVVSATALVGAAVLFVLVARGSSSSMRSVGRGLGGSW